MTQTIEDLKKIINNPNWKKIYLDSRYPPEDELKKWSEVHYVSGCGHECRLNETLVEYAGRNIKVQDYREEKRKFKKQIEKLDEKKPFRPDHIISERNKIHEALEIGVPVTARSRNKGGFYPGKIIGKNKDNTYQIEFPSFINRETRSTLKRDDAPVDSIMIGHWPPPELFWNRPYDEDKGIPYSYDIPWRKDWQREKPKTKERYTAKITFQYSPKPGPVLPMPEQIDVTDEHLRYNGRDWNYLVYTLKRKKDGIIMAEPGVPIVQGVYVPPVAHGVGGFPRSPPPYSPMVASAVPVPKSPGGGESKGGKRTKRRKSKKRRTRKYKKHRSKKGGDPRQIALNAFNFLTKKLKRISEGKDNYDDHAATVQALEERIRTTKGLTAKDRRSIKNTLRNIGKRAVAAMRDPCLAVALMNQERCTSKQFLDGGTAAAYETIGFDKTCNINTLQRAIEGFREHRIRSADTFSDAYDWCANHVQDGMIKVRDKKERRQEEKHQELLRTSPSYRARNKRMMTRLGEIEDQDSKAWGSGDLSVAQKEGRWDEDEQVTIGGKKKSKRKQRKRKHRKRKTKKRY